MEISTLMKSQQILNFSFRKRGLRVEEGNNQSIRTEFSEFQPNSSE